MRRSTPLPDCNPVCLQMTVTQRRIQAFLARLASPALPPADSDLRLPAPVPPAPLLSVTLLPTPFFAAPFLRSSVSRASESLSSFCKDYMG